MRFYLHKEFSLGGDVEENYDFQRVKVAPHGQFFQFVYIRCATYLYKVYCLGGDVQENCDFQKVNKNGSARLKNSNGFQKLIPPKFRFLLKISSLLRAAMKKLISSTSKTSLPKTQCSPNLSPKKYLLGLGG